MRKNIKTFNLVAFFTIVFFFFCLYAFRENSMLNRLSFNPIPSINNPIIKKWTNEVTWFWWVKGSGINAKILSQKQYAGEIKEYKNYITTTDGKEISFLSRPPKWWKIKQGYKIYIYESQRKGTLFVSSRYEKKYIFCSLDKKHIYCYICYSTRKS